MFGKNAHFVNDPWSWFLRGANWGNTLTRIGPLAFDRDKGGVNSTFGSRVVVAEYFCINEYDMRNSCYRRIKYHPVRVKT